MQSTHALLPFLLTSGVATVLLCGCATSKTIPLSQWENIDLKAVRLVSDGQEIALSESTPITLRLEPGGRVSGRAAVNRYFGTFSRVSDGSILWQGSLGSTRMAGPPEAMKLESEYLRTLTSTTILHAESAALTFQSADGKNLAEFTR